MTGAARPFGVALAVLTLAAAPPPQAAIDAAPPPQAAIDAGVAAAMQATGARSLAVAVVDRGRLVSATPYGVRTAAGDPLRADSILYGASLTKTVFADLVLQLAGEGRLGLDTSIAAYLPKPLPAYDDDDTARRYGRWSDLAGDERWRRITPRMLLNHSSGLANLAFLEPGGKLSLHFDPGSRYAYSGLGILLLQFVVERGLGIDVAAEAQRRVFAPLEMTDTAFTWRADFEGRAATGWTSDGQAPGHAHQSKVRAAGSMDTTIGDMGRFAAGLVRGAGLSRTMRRELTRPQLPITTASQFPTFQDELPPARRVPGLAAGAGVVVFDGPQGRGFMKGGHNDQTGNMMLCLVKPRRCVIFLGADVRAEAAYPELARLILGETGAPWAWEYGEMEFWRPPA